MSGSFAFAMFGSGVFTFTFVEYVHHLHAGHLAWFGRALVSSHRRHHADPREGGVTYLTKLLQRAPLVVGVLAMIGVPLTLATSATTSMPFLGGMLIAYLWSERFHHAIHHRAPRNRFERFMWRYHQVHHFADASKNIGFTSPLWDLILGTASFESPDVIRRRRRSVD